MSSNHSFSHPCTSLDCANFSHCIAYPKDHDNLIGTAFVKPELLCKTRLKVWRRILHQSHGKEGLPPVGLAHTQFSHAIFKQTAELTYSSLRDAGSLIHSLFRSHIYNRDLTFLFRPSDSPFQTLHSKLGSQSHCLELFSLQLHFSIWCFTLRRRRRLWHRIRQLLFALLALWRLGKLDVR